MQLSSTEGTEKLMRQQLFIAVTVQVITRTDFFCGSFTALNAAING